MSRRRFIELAAGAAGASMLLSVPGFAQSGGSNIDNVQVRTSVRNDDFSLRIDYRLDSAHPGATFLVQVTELDGTTTGLPGGRFPATQTGSGAWQQLLTMPWTQPHLWDVEAPYLYRVNVQLDSSAQQPIDVYPTIRFGFREVWRDGKHMMLNDHPLKLRQVPFLSRLPSMYFYAGMGMNAVEPQPNPAFWGAYAPTGAEGYPGQGMAADMPDLYDAADENGWIIFMPTIGVGAYKDGIGSGDPGQTSSWMTQVRQANKEKVLL